MAFQFREDGYFNMTKAAKHFGKDVRKFWINAETQEYLDALNETAPKSEQFVQTTMGRNGGTWGHPKLAVFFSRWLDIKFSIWCDSVIDDLLRGKMEATIVKPEESAVLALPKDFSSALRALADSVEQQEKLKAQTIEQAKQISHLSSLMMVTGSHHDQRYRCQEHFPDHRWHHH